MATIGSNTFVSDAARRFVKGAVGSSHYPMYLDANGVPQACFDDSSTGTQYLAIPSDNNYKFSVYCQGAQDGNADPQAGIRIDPGDGEWTYLMVWHSANGSPYLKLSNAGMYVLVSSTMYTQNTYVNGDYNLYLRRNAASGAYYTRGTITWSAWEGYTSLTNSGAETQYSGPANSEAAKIICFLPCYIQHFNNGAATDSKTVSWAGPQLRFRQYSMSSTDLTSTGHYEEYYFTTPSSDRDTDGSWKILTARNYVTVGQGGTGRGSWTADRLIYSSDSSTMTNSNIGTDGTHLSFNFLSPVDFTLSNNGISSGSYSRALWAYDMNGTYSALYLGAQTKSEGDNVAKFYVGNYVSGVQSWKGIDMTLAKDGTLTYSISDPAKFRTALGLGSNATSSTAYLPLAGGTMTGAINFNMAQNYMMMRYRNSSITKGTLPSASSPMYLVGSFDSAGVAAANRINLLYGDVTTDGTTRTYIYAYDFTSGSTTSAYMSITCSLGGTTKRTYTNAQIYGAVWNDYAEFRSSNYNRPGYCVIEHDDGILTQATERLMPGACIVSDTFGFAIGETKEADTPIAVTGRVLAYTYRDRYEYHAGMCVCSAPNGTVDIMTREEIMMYPDCIVGIVSEIPEYETWGEYDVAVDGRIWIKVK